jgi:hypothetical protein
MQVASRDGSLRRFRKTFVSMFMPVLLFETGWPAQWGRTDFLVGPPYPHKITPDSMPPTLRSVNTIGDAGQAQTNIKNVIYCTFSVRCSHQARARPDRAFISTRMYVNILTWKSAYDDMLRRSHHQAPEWIYYSLTANGACMHYVLA